MKMAEATKFYTKKIKYCQKILESVRLERPTESFWKC